MLPIFEAYFERLARLHHDMKAAMAGLPQAALDWEPGPGMNSIAVLVAHTAGSERYWIGEVAGQDPAHRHRPAEFETRGLDEAALVARLDEALAHSQGVLTRLAPDDLEAARTTSMWEQPTTAGWALLHALEHTGQHVGHVQMTRQLWEQK
ncbi:MAG: DUF1572 domain-containing protein [Chloroflexi bacterium]|nr:DUF1572 domain-containing protein [Chloroflexota bacterium]MCI0577713.1 DUF1572 domain-containing protein [Chloroflexota bacterium]MCI0649796.1 DUF1572 domain-containing protein [Chloroflexota bacterium]MCI0730505.1 DUF1572 domain-containing protein [Chloroflexota bacterium]